MRMNRFISFPLGLAITIILSACVNTDDGGDASSAPLHDPGSFDSGFGSDGVSLLDNSSETFSSNGKAVQVLANSKILVVAETRPKNRADYDYTLLRIKRDGSLDSDTSGADGFALNGGVINFDLDNFSNEKPTCMTLDSQGRILVSGHQLKTGWNLTSARFSSGGALDTSFGDNSSGIATTTLPTTGTGISVSYAQAIARFPDDSFVVAGRTNDGGSSFDMALARYDANGQLDTSFNSVGTINIDFEGAEDQAHAVAVVGNPSVAAQDSRIFVAGFASMSGQGRNFALLKLNLSGQLDSTFNATGTTPGQVVLHLMQNDVINAMAIQKDGKIVVAGASGSNNINHFIVLRYNADGSLDTDFNSVGYTTTDLGGNLEEIQAIAIDSSGRIIAAGTSNANNGIAAFAIVRYLSNGSLDLSFGENATGAVIKKMSNAVGGEDQVSALVLDGNGIVVVGTANLATQSEQVAMLRLFQ